MFVFELISEVLEIKECGRVFESTFKWLLSVVNFFFAKCSVLDVPGFLDLPKTFVYWEYCHCFPLSTQLLSPKLIIL